MGGQCTITVDAYYWAQIQCLKQKGKENSVQAISSFQAVSEEES